MLYTSTITPKRPIPSQLQFFFSQFLPDIFEPDAPIVDTFQATKALQEIPPSSVHVSMGASPETVRKESSLDWVIRRDPALDSMLSELGELMQEEIDEQYGLYNPTDYALVTTAQLLIESSLQLGCKLSIGAVSSDAAGGIRIEWHNRNREVRLIIPAAEGGQEYVYHESGDSYNLENQVSTENLAKWLTWLMAA